jgi:Cu-processing system ATP-binding protein
VIAFERFTKRYGAITAVNDVSLHVASGEIVALLGPNGSGKTTMLKAAAGLIRPSSGRVLVGDPLRPACEPDARVGVSYLPQRVSFPDALTGREVVEFYRRLRGIDVARTDAVLHFASLNGAGSRAVGTYSGGMTQRLGLAVAMVPDAPVMLLDEPTAALDPDGLCAFYGLVEQGRGHGRTLLFTSHQLGDVERLADRFAVLVNGILVAALTEQQLSDRLASRGVMKLRVSDADEPLLERIRRVAPAAEFAAGQLIVPGGATLRPIVIDIVRNAGLEIRGLTAQEGRLDDLYRELVAASPDRQEHAA